MSADKIAHAGEITDALKTASGLRGSFDTEDGGAWIDADRGADSCTLDGQFTAAELRMIADFMNPTDKEAGQ